MKNINDILRQSRAARIRHENHACPLVGEFDDCYSYLGQACDLIDEALGAMQGFQKATGADRADWDFSYEIKQIEEFLQ